MGRGQPATGPGTGSTVTGGKARDSAKPSNNRRPSRSTREMLLKANAELYDEAQYQKKKGQARVNQMSTDGQQLCTDEFSELIEKVSHIDTANTTGECIEKIIGMIRQTESNLTYALAELGEDLSYWDTDHEADGDSEESEDEEDAEPKDDKGDGDHTGGDEDDDDHREGGTSYSGDEAGDHTEADADGDADNDADSADGDSANGGSADGGSADADSADADSADADSADADSDDNAAYGNGHEGQESNSGDGHDKEGEAYGQHETPSEHDEGVHQDLATVDMPSEQAPSADGRLLFLVPRYHVCLDILPQDNMIMVNLAGPRDTLPGRVLLRRHKFGKGRADQGNYKFWELGEPPTGLTPTAEDIIVDEGSTGNLRLLLEAYFIIRDTKSAKADNWKKMYLQRLGNSPFWLSAENRRELVGAADKVAKIESYNKKVIQDGWHLRTVVLKKGRKGGLQRGNGSVVQRRLTLERGLDDERKIYVDVATRKEVQPSAADIVLPESEKTFRKLEELLIHVLRNSSVAQHFPELRDGHSLVSNKRSLSQDGT